MQVPAYTAALSVLDGDMPQYIHDNTDDEDSHQKFLNAFLESIGAEPVDLEPFRTLPGSQASGADPNKKRLTNLMQLTVDTSWYTRYRGIGNPVFGDVFPPAVPGLNVGQHPAIPITNADLMPSLHLQAIAPRRAFILRPSSKVVRVFTAPSFQRRPAKWCCESCTLSEDRR
jgi:hypothetical protein